MIEKEGDVKDEQENSDIFRFMKDDGSDIQEDSATEEKFYSLDELHILDMLEQVSMI